MLTLVKTFASKGGKYRFELYRDDTGFTFKEYTGKHLSGGGGYGTKTEAEVMEYVTKYLAFFPSAMRETP